MPENILTYCDITVPEEEVFGLPVRLYHHIFHGRVSQNYRIYGVHHIDALTHRTANFHVGDIRIVSGSRKEKGNGFYKAAIECWNGKEWLGKKENHSNGFFPDNWTRKQVMEEIAGAKEKLTIDDWQKPFPPYKKSNAYLRQLSCSQSVVFYLGSPKKNKPAKLDRYIVTVFPYFEAII